MNDRTVLLNGTIDRVDTDLVRFHAGLDPALYRLTMQNICYFVDVMDVDEKSFKRVPQLLPGTNVRACVFEERGRQKIAWLAGQDVTIAPRDVFGETRRWSKVLVVALCGLVLMSLAACKVDGIALGTLAILGAGISALACLLSAIAVIGSLDARRREAQRVWGNR